MGLRAWMRRTTSERSQVDVARDARANLLFLVSSPTFNIENGKDALAFYLMKYLKLLDEVSHHTT